MPLWHPFHHSHSHGHGGDSNHGSAPSSRPSSRPPSPTRTNTRTSLNSNHSGASASLPIPRSSSSGTPSNITAGPVGSHGGVGASGLTVDTTPLTANNNNTNDYFGDAPIPTGGPTGTYTAPSSLTNSSAFNSPATSFAPTYGSSSDMWRENSGAMTPSSYYAGHGHAQPVEIILDSENLVMRGQGADMNPAYLSGRVELNLPEATNVKEISMTLQGKAKVQFNEPGAGKNHHFTHPIIHHDWSFLQGDKRHNHTLKAGFHSFPFNFMLDGNLPATITTYNGDGHISYKLRATVVRAGFTAHNYNAVKSFTVNRTYTAEALEFNQTMEIENTWPGKIMYSLTLPFKAYAAGDDIPVIVKFMPLAKGVRVTSVSSVLKEYTLVHTRHSSHPEQRVAASIKHELRNGRAYEAAKDPGRQEANRPPSHQYYSGNLSSHNSSNQASRAASRHASPSATPMPTPRSLPNATAGPSSGNAVAGGSSDVLEGDDEDITIGDEEINTSLTIPIPVYVTPTHTTYPVFVTHKIKWSCSISNPDGHVSELRCALPIIILDHSLLEEARTSGAATRALLFGGQVEETQQVDLPSYSNHVYDRVAADSGATQGYVSRSAQATPLPSPHHETPPHSRTPSRPGSPTQRALNFPDGNEDAIPAEPLPPRPTLDNWEDSELLLSLGALRAHSHNSSPHDTPGDSRSPSRPLSRRNSRSGRSSRVGSRAGSRANSPERHSGSNSGSNTPLSERRGSGLTSRLHLPSGFSALRPLSGAKPILRNGSSANLVSSSNPGTPGGLNTNGHDAVLRRNAASFGNLNGHVSFGGETRRHFVVDVTDTDNHQQQQQQQPDPESVPAISRVPAYDIAQRGFAGALDTGPPTYDDSERQIERTRSEMDLAMMRARSDTDLMGLRVGEVAPNAGAAAEAAEGERTEAQREGEGEGEGGGVGAVEDGHEEGVIHI